MWQAEAGPGIIKKEGVTHYWGYGGAKLGVVQRRGVSPRNI